MEGTESIEIQGILMILIVFMEIGTQRIDRDRLMECRVGVVLQRIRIMVEIMVVVIIITTQEIPRT